MFRKLTNPPTVHHTHRYFHGLVFAISIIFVALLSWSLGIVLSSVLAQSGSSTTQQSSATTTKTQSEVSYPTIESTGEPVVTVVPGESIQQRYILKDAQVQPVFIFGSQYPKFIGSTSIKNALIKISVTGQVDVRAKILADSKGNWSWQPVIALDLGAHNLTVIAEDPINNKITATDNFAFETALSKNQTSQKPKSSNVEQLGNNGNLFDVFVSIPQQFKHLNQGSELSANVRLVNFGSAGQPVDVEVHYTIKNSDNEIVSETSETVAVATKLSFLKTFYTEKSLPVGQYTLTVAVPSKDLIATATDTFQLQVATSDTGTATGYFHNLFNKGNINLGIIIALLLAGGALAYFEYRKISALTKIIKKIQTR